jgi:hypothetical protein
LNTPDENLSFFHRIANNKLAKGSLNGLDINGEWATDPSTLKKEAFCFLSNKFNEPFASRPDFLLPNLKRLSAGESEFLIAPFVVQEIKSTIWDCGGENAPGPDGFTFAFIKHYWELLEADFVDVLNHSIETGSFTGGVAHRLSP